MTHASVTIAREIVADKPNIPVRELTSEIIERHSKDGCVFHPDTIAHMLAKYGDGPFAGDVDEYGNAMHDEEIVQGCLKQGGA